MKKLINQKIGIVAFILALFISFIPMISLAAGLIPCGDEGEEMCTFLALFDSETGLVRKVMDYALIIAIPLAVLSIAASGFKMVILTDKPGALKDFKDTVKWVAWGLLLALGAWLLVVTALKVIVNDDFVLPVEQ